MRAGAWAGKRPARWWQSQESVTVNTIPFPRATQAPVWAFDDGAAIQGPSGGPRCCHDRQNVELGARAVQNTIHGINILLDRGSDGAGRGRVAMFSSEFAGEIMGEVPDAL